MRTIVYLGVIAGIVGLMVFSPEAFAGEEIISSGPYTKAAFAIGAMIAAGFAIGVGATGAGLGIGLTTGKACDGVARNPGVQAKIMTMLLIGLAMAESITIYALVIALVLLFANPYMSYFLG